jgi:O-antigen/teichoic acid export membrane protein
MPRSNYESGIGTGTGTGIARHAAINLLGGVFAPAASFAAGPILAHALSVEGRGELAAATMPLVLTVSLATIGLPEAVTYFIARDRRRTKMLAKRGALLILLPATIATAILIVVSTWISDGNPTVHRLIVISAALVAPSLLLSIIRAVAAANNKWTAITIERITTAATKLIPLIILFAMGELNLIAAAIVTIASTLTGAIAYIPLLLVRNSGPAPEAVTNTQLIRFGSGMWIGSISGMLLLRIDQVFLSPLAGNIQLGLYAVAVSISELPLIVNTAIRETAFTSLSDRGVRPAEIGDLSRVSTIIVAALCLPVGALSPILIPSLFGTEFRGSVPVLVILLFAVCLANPGSMAGVGLSSSGFPHLRSVGLVVACFANIALLLLLTPQLGAIGAAVATLLGNLTASNVCIAWMIARRGATLGDYYRFRSNDFVRVSHILRRGVRKFTRRSEIR